MQRHRCTPRPAWREKVAETGLTYHSHEDGPYWDESACYALTAGEVGALERAAKELHVLCIDAAETVIARGWWDRLGIAEAAVPAILRSWERDDFSLYGRFDLAFDGRGAPKLLEYNADTPTALVEAAVTQWFWLRETRPEADQFNSIHERLVDAWARWAQTLRAGAGAAGGAGRHGAGGEQACGAGADERRGASAGAGAGASAGAASPENRYAVPPVYFAAVREHAEDEQTVLYLRDTAQQAGVATRPIYVDEVGWDARVGKFVDLDGGAIEHAFKLYPWEWLWREEFAPHLAGDQVRWLEPTWKMLLSNKGLLPVLWELFPGHPNLLPAYEQAEPLGARYVRKPKLSREGANVAWMEGGTAVEETGGDYGAEGFVYQAAVDLPEAEGNRAVCGVWIVDHEPAGLGIREDTRRITGNLSRFVPHFFT